MSKIELPTRSKPVLDLNDLPDDLLITIKDQGQVKVISKSQLMDLINAGLAAGSDRTPRRKRSDQSRIDAGLSQRFNIIWKSVVKGELQTATETLSRAVTEIGKGKVMSAFNAKLEARASGKERDKVKNFILSKL